MLDRRHTLARLKPHARNALVPALLDGLPHTMQDIETKALVLRTFLTEGVPGIVCRPTRACGEGQGQLGFSFPLRRNEERVRSSLIVEPDQIASFISPYEVMERALRRFPPPHAALRLVAGIATRFDIRLGLIGSAALAAVTGLPYVRPQSDLDLLVDADHGGDVQAFHRTVQGVGQAIGVKIDTEIEFFGSRGVKLAEFCSGRETILAKTITGVELIDIVDLQNRPKGRGPHGALRAALPGANSTPPATETIQNQWSE